ncbi:MAG: hypothetical protein JW750_05115 [Anaerolineaceae bacterium]|nr:hypothetical protein [Anaerolineaceae bacterium]
MKKSIFLIISIMLVLSMVLAACGGQTPTEAPVVEEPTEEEAAPAEEEEVVVEEEAPAEEEEVVEEEETPTEEVVVEEPPTTRKGGWLDEVAMTVVTAESSVTQIEAGAIDIYASGLATPQDLAAIEAAGFEKSTNYGLFYELTFNPVGPTFDATGKLNPFYSAKVREAMNWLVDRDYINQEVYGGVSIPKFFPITAGFPDYAKHVEFARALEAKYAYNMEKATEVITEEMVAMGAEMVDGKWTYEGEPVELIFLIRNDSDGTRIPIGDYVSTQLEKIGFTVDRQYKTSSESSPLWVLGDPQDGTWHIYTGAWIVTAVDRDQGDNFQFYYTPQSAYAFSPLWQVYEVSDEFTEISEKLALNNFTTLEERSELFAAAMEQTFEYSYRVWLIDGVGFTPWRPEVTVAFDLAAGVDAGTLWPYTLRFEGQEGGTMKWGTSDLFVDPANPVAGSNWTYDAQWRNPTGDYGVITNPYTGVPLPQRIESAEVTVQTGLPVGQTYDWVTLNFSDEITVPEDAWIDWDVESQTFVTVGEMYPDGLTALRKSVVYYPADFYETVKWHDGSNISAADFVMGLIMTWEPGMEGSAIFDESFVPVLESFKSAFKGVRFASTDPLTIEFYSDVWAMDAESNVTTLWPEYGYGNAGWHQIAISNLAEANGELAYSADKATAAGIEWTNYVAGPSLDILAAKLDEAAAESLVPYAATLGDFITADEAAARYANLAAFYAEHGHFWLGTGPYILDKVYPVEKTLTLVHNPDFPDMADKWDIFSAPKMATLEIDGAGRVTAGAPATFDVFVSFEGEAYPVDEIDQVKYLLYNSTGEIVEVGEATAVEDGYFMVELTEESTALLDAGACKLEVAVVAIPVSVPAFASFEFVVD